MRITGGRFGGRLLASPPDERVRPTSDKVRQAVFNILVHNDFGREFAIAGARAIDVFAGTGAMGLEALSRSARYCLFIDNSAESRALVRRNIEALALTGMTKIWRRDATNLGPLSANSGGPFELAFLDPPYRHDLLQPALESMRDGGWLVPGAIVVVEGPINNDLPELPGFQTMEARTYGDTSVNFLRTITDLKT